MNINEINEIYEKNRILKMVTIEIVNRKRKVVHRIA